MQKINKKLVAHRGFSKEYPENSHAAILAALQSGAYNIEFDVQLSKDEIPYVIHDSELKRTTGKDGLIYELSSVELKEYKVAFVSRFGDTYAHESLPSLEKIVELLSEWPNCKVFVEAKRASISRFGLKSVYENIVKVLDPILKQAIIISFDIEFVKYAKQQGFPQIAWVFDQWNDTVKDQLYRLQPEYVFTDWECVPTDIIKLWPGAWHWVIYEIDDPQLALDWINKGADLIETNDIGGMLKSLQDSAS